MTCDDGTLLLSCNNTRSFFFQKLNSEAAVEGLAGLVIGKLQKGWYFRWKARIEVVTGSSWDCGANNGQGGQALTVAADRETGGRC